MQSGRFYLNGDLRFFARQAHLAGSGQVRLDLNAPTVRVAVISGSLRLSLGSVLIKLGGESSPFHDPAGDGLCGARSVVPLALRRRGAGPDRGHQRPGSAASSGAAKLQIANPGDVLSLGQTVLTGAQAWAEVGFGAAAYLRLQPDSALSVVSVDKLVNPSGTAQRQITLQLTRGSAWNVVAEPQGGYEITAPTVTTAVRGTLFRVDASGLVKVLEGQVAVPSRRTWRSRPGNSGPAAERFSR